MKKNTKMQIVKGQPVEGEGMLVQNTGYWTMMRGADFLKLANAGKLSVGTKFVAGTFEARIVMAD